MSKQQDSTLKEHKCCSHKTAARKRDLGPCDRDADDNCCSVCIPQYSTTSDSDKLTSIEQAEFERVSKRPVLELPREPDLGGPICQECSPSLDEGQSSPDERSLVVEAPSSKRTSSTRSTLGRETYESSPAEPRTDTASSENGDGIEYAGYRGSRDMEIAHLGAQFFASSTSSSSDAYHVEREVIEDDGKEWQSHTEEDKNASHSTDSSTSYS